MSDSFTIHHEGYKVNYNIENDLHTLNFTKKGIFGKKIKKYTINVKNKNPLLTNAEIHQALNIAKLAKIIAKQEKQPVHIFHSGTKRTITVLINTEGHTLEALKKQYEEQRKTISSPIKRGHFSNIIKKIDKVINNPLNDSPVKTIARSG